MIVTTDETTIGASASGVCAAGGPTDQSSPPDCPVSGPSFGATLSCVGHVTGSTARRVACDADVTTVRIGPDGEVLGTRAERRYFSPAQLRAMIARDGDRCFWPWCGHHLQLHEGRWRAQRLPDGRYIARHRDDGSSGPSRIHPGTTGRRTGASDPGRTSSHCQMAPAG